MAHKASISILDHNYYHMILLHLFLQIKSKCGIQIKTSDYVAIFFSVL